MQDRPFDGNRQVLRGLVDVDEVETSKAMDAAKALATASGRRIAPLTSCLAPHADFTIARPRSGYKARLWMARFPHPARLR
jgi:hypothetical protein